MNQDKIKKIVWLTLHISQQIYIILFSSKKDISGNILGTAMTCKVSVAGCVVDSLWLDFLAFITSHSVFTVAHLD